MSKNKLGFMVTVEGLDGCGKTTTVEVLKGALEKAGLEVLVVPGLGGTDYADKCKQLLIDPANELDFYSQLHLIVSLRKDIYDKLIRPAILAGKVVIVDRWVDSTITMQAFGIMWNDPNTDEQKLIRAHHLAREVRTLTTGTIGHIQPRFTLLITADTATRNERLAAKTIPDVFESRPEEFYRWVQIGYDYCCEVNDRGRFIKIDTTNLSTTKVTPALETLVNNIVGEYSKA